MDTLPRELTVHVLSYFKDSSVIKNFRTVCKAFYQLNMTEKSQFIIKAMPANSLDLLSTMTSGSKKKFSLTFQSPTLAMQKIPNKFINTLTGLKNLTGLDISSFSLPLAAQTKLNQLTNLERLSIESLEINLSPITRLSKLEIQNPDQSYSCSNQYLTNLVDMSLGMAPERNADLSCFHKLTRLCVQFVWGRVHNRLTLNLTTMSNLKDLSIRSSHPYLSIKLEASCTTLESIDIEPIVNDFNFEWISSNTRLTNFMVNTGYNDAAQITPLTNLQNILSMKIYDINQFHILSDLRGLTHLEAFYLHGEFRSEDLAQYTNLRSVELKSQYLDYFPTELTNLTKITWSNVNVSNTSYPTSVKELDTGYIVYNLKELTKLESLILSSPPDNIGPDVHMLKNLTKVVFSFKDFESTLRVLPNLSNLFSLKELSVTTPHKCQRLNADFLTTLTNLEALNIPSVSIPLQVFDKIVQRQTQLTLLRVNCPDASGATLTRLTNLQVLSFYSTVPMKGWKTLLEEKLSRLTTAILP